MSEALADLRQPVLVGIGTCMQREDDFAQAMEPMDLMLEAVRRAGHDAGGAQVLQGVQHIAVPKGRWRYRNPAGEIARAVGADAATTVLANLGVLQQTLIGEACQRIATGEIDSALVAGADAGYRILRARQAGQRASERQQEDLPDLTLDAEEELLHPAELRAGIKMPVALYAILESAWRAKKGLSMAEHQRQLNDMAQAFSRVAAANPHAWRRKQLAPADLQASPDRNPMQAFPYTRLHCTSWNVDQAGALLLCSAGKARALGIAPSQWVYALASTESNHMLPVSARADLTGCLGAQLAGQSALAAGGLDASMLDLVELYSCFPIAVESFAQELGLSSARDLTVTGGMPLAGGPFNNYVLQATCRMAELIRSGSGRNGIVSSVSGVLTKQGFGLWARQPGSRPFALDDVTAQTASQTQTRQVANAFDGNARVAGYTVLHDKGQAPRVLVLADTDTGCRALASSDDPDLTAQVQIAEFCGAKIRISGGLFSPA